MRTYPPGEAQGWCFKGKLANIGLTESHRPAAPRASAKVIRVTHFRWKGSTLAEAMERYIFLREVS
jgi:hypothetical protein